MESEDKMVRIPRELHKKLKLLATENDKSIKDTLTEIVEEKIDE